MPKLTKRFVDSVIPQDKERVYWDEALPGFGLRVRSSGGKVFICQYRNSQGRTRKLTLGAYGKLTVDMARKLAKERLGEVARGQDPAEAKSAGRSAPAFSELASRYMAEHSEVKKKAESIRKDRFLVDQYILPALGRYNVDEVTREQIAKLHHSLREKPYQANRVLEVVRKMFNLAEAWGLRPDGSNPARHIQKYKEKKRQRYLSKDEWARLGKVLVEIEREDSGLPSVVTAVRLLIFTGCRLSEVLTLRWDDVDWDRGCLNLLDSKTGQRFVPLGQVALDLLESTPRQAGNPFVCPGARPMRPLVNLQQPWRRIRERAGLEDVRLHDLRHSFASVGAAAGLSLPVIGALLGHTQAATTQRYAHLAQDPVKQAADQVASLIDGAMRAPTKQKVMSIDARDDRRT
ncbi:site-specific integrase [Desulfoferula mesophila]|uniref:Integrase n=1 Tax=Desulfoferula mesophila TaxID=3058419 RepID=A0AAU9EE36_9BACT|nr:integrase [Desulfoferula mesophilus]